MVQAVILAGGLGTRMREETEFRPKPMVEIGGKPILLHIMENLIQGGITEIIVSTGYKSEVINQYFHQESHWHHLPGIDPGVARYSDPDDKVSVTLAYTGEDTGTGGRVLKVAHLLTGERFFVTYGDGLANVDLAQVFDLHSRSGRLATLTAVQPTSRFGILDLAEDGAVTHFREKPRMKDWVSIGFFVFERRVLDYLTPDGGLEEEGLTRLAAEGQLSAHRHEGFWQPMDTYREYKILEDLWNSGNPPWKTSPS